MQIDDDPEECAGAHVEISDYVLEGLSDTTRDIGVAAHKKKVVRRTTYHGKETEEPTVSSIHQPGGFRRQFVIEQGATGTIGDHQERIAGLNLSENQVKYAEKTSFIEQILQVQTGFTDVQKADASCESFSTAYGAAKETDGSAASLGKSMRVIYADGRLASELLPGFIDRSKLIQTRGQLSALIVKSFVTCGVFFMPKMVHQTGLLLAPVVIVVSGAITIYGVTMLIDCADEAKMQSLNPQGWEHMPSYGEIGFRAFGKVGLVAVNASLTLSQLGFCCSYCVLLIQNIQESYQAFYGMAWSLSSTSCALIIFFVCSPLSWIRRMSVFAVPSFSANTFTMAIMVLVVVICAGNLITTPTLPDVKMVNKEGLLVGIGMAMSMLEGIGMMVPAYTQCSPETRKDFRHMVAFTLSVLCLSYIFFGWVAYTAFGPEISTCVLFSLPQGMWKSTAQLMFLFCLFVAFPLGAYPVIQILEPLLIQGSGKTSTVVKVNKNIFRTTTVAFVVSLATIVGDKLHIFVSFIGVMCALPLMIIYPALMHYQLIGMNRKLNIFLVFVGCVVMVSAFYAIMIDLKGPASAGLDALTA